MFVSYAEEVLGDSYSLPLVAGSVIDHEDWLMGAGFTVANPNTSVSCGCGQSFRVDADSCPTTPRAENTCLG